MLTAGAMGIVAGTTLLAEHHAVSVAVLVTTAGLLAMTGFWLLERRTSHPLVMPAARRSPRLRWGAAGSFLNTATTSGSVTVATFYLQGELGLPPVRAAAVLVSFSLLVVLGSLGAPRIIRAFGWGGASCVGLGVIAAGNGLLVLRPDVIGIGVAAAICGLGIGVGSVAATDLGTAVDEEIKATAAGVLNTAAQLGTAIGTALILVVSTTFQPRTAWAVVAALAGVAAFAAVVRAPRGATAPTGRTAGAERG
jgi:MFS family permease